MLRKVVEALERRIHGDGSFPAEVRATRTLLKFCEAHQVIHPDLKHVRTCLLALEVGAKSRAVAAFEEVWRGKEGLGDEWPKAMFPHEDGDYVWGISEALFERWCRLMQDLKSK
ncbi:MAG: hypothetical protein RLY20_1473 [Verrucomicrobiota bacterium]|jgi:hypothetical protein